MNRDDKSKTGVVIVDHGSRKEESNERLLEFVDLYRAATSYLAVEPAHMEIATPTILDGFHACKEKGAEQIIVCPFFLLPGRHWQSDIPRLAREASDACEYIPFLVSAPIGVHEKLIEILESRIDFCVASHPNEICSSCTMENNCKTNSNWS